MDFTKKVFDPRMERTLEQLQDERAISVDGNESKDYQLIEKPMNLHASHNVEMLKGRHEPTMLDYLFFSNKNIQIIQNAIRKKVYDISGHVISNQSENELLQIMRSIFFLNLPLSFPNITENIKFLNKVTVDKALPKILTNMKQYLIYLKDLQHTPIPIDRPKEENIKGTNQIGFKPFI